MAVKPEGAQIVSSPSPKKFSEISGREPPRSADPCKHPGTFSIALVTDPGGRLAGVAAILRDVTERWNRDREMQERVRRLEARQSS